MKVSTSRALLGALVPLASAFPMELMGKFTEDPKMMARAMNMISERQAGAESATSIFETVPTFDAKSQYIDVGPGSGHEWQAPGPNDLRGVCPGLNAFANHGFLPRNGYATIQQFIDATTQVVGMGPDLALFLSVLGALIDSGDLTSWSIGGFVNLDSLTTYRSQRFDRQIANNPYFFNAPFPGLLVQPAAFTFIYRFMANHSDINPVGLLSYEVLQSWFGIEGTNGNYSAPFGYERIPANWYRRSQTAPYTIPYFLGDVAAAAVLHPKFLDIGGNQGGKTNNFAGVELQNLTNGVFNTPQLLQGNNLGCFVFQVITQVKADFILGGVLTSLQDVVGGIIGKLSCPQLQSFDESLLEQFPGYQKSPEFSSNNALLNTVGSVVGTLL